MTKINKLCLVLLCCLVALAGCGQKSTAVSESEEVTKKLKIVTTSFPPYDFVREIAGDKVEVSMLISPGAESHSFEPTPQDLIKIQNCDLFIYGGGETEAWVEQLLESIDIEESRMLSMMEAVALLEEEEVEGMEVEEDHDHGHEEEQADDHEQEAESQLEYDEHVWTSPKNVIQISRQIATVLSTLDEENAPLYAENLSHFVADLEELDGQFQEVVDNAQRTVLVFGDRFPFRYFVAEYGLDYYAAFPGCSTETEPSAATIAFLINKVKEESILIVFYTEGSNQKMADTICEATNAEKRIFYATHNISKEDYENGKGYLDFMRANVETLKEALQ